MTVTAVRALAGSVPRRTFAAVRTSVSGHHPIVSARAVVARVTGEAFSSDSRRHPTHREAATDSPTSGHGGPAPRAHEVDSRRVKMLIAAQSAQTLLQVVDGHGANSLTSRECSIAIHRLSKLVCDREGKESLLDDRRFQRIMQRVCQLVKKGGQEGPSDRDLAQILSALQQLGYQPGFDFLTTVPDRITAMDLSSVAAPPNFLATLLSAFSDCRLDPSAKFMQWLADRCVSGDLKDCPLAIQARLVHNLHLLYKQGNRAVPPRLVSAFVRMWSLEDLRSAEPKHLVKLLGTLTNMLRLEQTQRGGGGGGGYEMRRELRSLAKAFMDSCVSHGLDDLTPLQLMTALAVPYRLQSNLPPAFVRAFEHACPATRLRSFDSAWLSAMVDRLAKMGGKPNLPFLARIVRECRDRELTSFKPQDLGQLVRALVGLKFDPGVGFARQFAHACLSFDFSRPDAGLRVSQALHYLGIFQTYHEAALVRLVKLWSPGLEPLHGQAPQVDVAEASLVLTSLAKLSFYPGEDVLNSVAALCCHPPRLAPTSIAHLCYVLHGFARMDHDPGDECLSALISEISSPEKLAAARLSDLGQVIWSLAVLNRLEETAKARPDEMGAVATRIIEELYAEQKAGTLQQDHVLMLRHGLLGLQLRYRRELSEVREAVELVWSQEGFTVAPPEPSQLQEEVVGELRRMGASVQTEVTYLDGLLSLDAVLLPLEPGALPPIGFEVDGAVHYFRNAMRRRLGRCVYKARLVGLAAGHGLLSGYASCAYFAWYGAQKHNQTAGLLKARLLESRADLSLFMRLPEEEEERGGATGSGGASLRGGDRSAPTRPEAH